MNKMRQIRRNPSSGSSLGTSILQNMWILVGVCAILALELLVEAKKKQKNSGGDDDSSNGFNGSNGSNGSNEMPMEVGIAIAVFVAVVIFCVFVYYCYKKCVGKSASTSSVSNGDENAGS